MKLRRVLGTLSTAALVSVGAVVVAPTAQAVVLSCGTIISTPGTYTLTADMNCAGTFRVFGVLIISDNVTLDLNGHSITGDIDPSGGLYNLGVWVSSVAAGGTADNVVVKNGTITKWNVGIFLDTVNNGRVQNMNVHDNIGPDVQEIYGEGIQIFEGGGHTITGNQVVHNGPFAGIDVYGPTSNNTITNNSVRDNNILGGPHGGAGDTMQDIGIWVIALAASPPTSSNLVSGNSVTGNGLDGIQVATGTNGNTVTNNQVVNNGFGQPPANPFRDGNGIAIFGNSNLVQSNSAVHNGANGVGIIFPPNGNSTFGKSNTIRLNIAALNGTATTPSSIFDLFDANTTPTPCDSNVWVLNVGLTRNQTCVH